MSQSFERKVHSEINFHRLNLRRIFAQLLRVLLMLKYVPQCFHIHIYFWWNYVQFSMHGVPFLNDLKARLFRKKCVLFVVCRAVSPVTSKKLNRCWDILWHNYLLFFSQMHSLHQLFLFIPLVILKSFPLMTFDILPHPKNTLEIYVFPHFILKK